jgi:MFS family permease
MALLTQLGTLFGVLGTGMIMGEAPEWQKYALVVVVLLGVGFVTIAGVKETPLPHAPKIHWGEYVKSLWISPRDYPDFAWVWITRALVMLGFYAILPYVNYYLGDVIGVKKPEEQAAMLIGALLFASSISGISGGYISDRIGRKKVVYIANCMIAVAALAFIACRTMPQVFVAGIFFGVGFGAYTSVDWALGTDVLPSKKDAAKEMAVWHISMTLPQSIAAPFAAVLISAPGMTEEHRGLETIPHYTVMGYSYIFVLCAICFGLGAFLLKNVRGVR